MVNARERAQAVMGQGKPTYWAAGAVIVAIWLLVAAALAVVVWKIVRD